MLPKFSVKKPFTIVVAVILVLLLGVISFTNLTTSLFPNIDFPYIVAVTTYPGASPEQVETVVTKPLEQAVSTVSNIQNVSSVSQENSSMVVMEFAQDTNMDSAMMDINAKIDLVESAWDDSISSPTLLKLNPNMLPVMLLSVDVEGMDTKEISALVSDTLLPEFQKIEGVASVSAMGLVEETVQIRINPDKIDELNQTILRSIDSELADAQEQLDNAKQQLSDGRAQLDSQERTQSARLSSAQSALTEGQNQLTEGQNQLNAAKDQLSSGQTALLEAKEQLETAQSTLSQTKSGLETALAQAEQEEAALQARIDELMSLPSLTPEEQTELDQLQTDLALVQAGKTQTEDQLADVDSQLSDVVTQLESTNTQLDSLGEQLSALDSQQAELDSKQDELTAQQVQLDSARSMLDSQISSARAQLDSGEAELAEKTEEFEAARDQAYAEASLDGVITPDLISGLLTAENFSMPAGFLTDDNLEYTVKIGDEFDSLDSLSAMVLMSLGLDEIDVVRLSDVADVTLEDNSDEIYAKVNGNDGVILSFQQQSDYATSEISSRIQETAAALTAANPALHISTLMDQGIYIDMIVGSVIENLLYGAVLAILVLLLFLRNAKPTVIVAVSIPISVIFTVAMMYFTGITLNVISLAGLALGIGMLVDNSIVVIENTYRLRSQGLSAAAAAVQGAKQVSGAIIASTITTICVFLPIVFTQGLSRQLFTDMGLTIAYSLLASLIVALTLVPTMSSTLLRQQKEKPQKWFIRFQNGYSRLLSWFLRRKAVLLIFVAVLLVFSGYMVSTMGLVFMPDMDSTQISVSLQAPEGSTFEQTKEYSDEVLDRLIELPDVETVGAIPASSSLGSSDSTSMSFYLILKEDKTHTNDELEQEILDRTADINCTVSVSTSNMDMSALGGSGLELMIKGDDMDTLQTIAKDTAAILADIPGTTEISDGLDHPAAELRVTVDKDKAMEYGLTVAQVYSQVADLLSEQTASTELSMDGQDYPIIVVDANTEDLTIEELKQSPLTYQTADGEEAEIALSKIASVATAQGPSAIQRDAQQRYLSVSAQIDADHNISLVSREVEEKLADYALPSGYSIEIVGENETINESLGDLLLMIALAIVFVYLIMVAQFQSLLSPFIVMFTIPLACTGGILALLITGSELSIIALLGFLILTGVVVNNGIVFVDCVNQLRLAGMEKRDALVEAGRIRIRPILMTAITTILGLLTLACGVGSGAEMLQPMAIVTIGGLTYATAMTLFVVPVLYDIFQRRPLKRRLSEKEEETL